MEPGRERAAQPGALVSVDAQKWGEPGRPEAAWVPAGGPGAERARGGERWEAEPLAAEVSE